MKRFNLFVLAILFLTSCDDIFGPDIKGSGNILSEERQLSHFDQVLLEGDYEVEIIKGREFKFEIEADDNIIPIIRSSVDDGQLKVYSIENYRPSETIKIWITLKNMSSLTLRGSAEVSSNDTFTGEDIILDLSGSGRVNLHIDCITFDAHISGSGSFTIDGVADYQEISISGSGKYDGSNLFSKTAKASISGSGHLYVHSRDYLKAIVSGSGNIYYYGIPTIETWISGSGNIIKR